MLLEIFHRLFRGNIRLLRCLKFSIVPPEADLEIFRRHTKILETPPEMIPLESGEVLHARQMTLNYHILIVVVLAILEGLHIRL